MKGRWILVGLGVVVIGLGFAVKASAGQKGSKADDKPDPSGGPLEVRHGIAHDGCSHFELRDQDAIRDWAESNALRFAKWLPQIDAVKADPEPFLVDLFSALFPECQWPPRNELTTSSNRVTFGPQNESWAEAVERIKTQLAGFEMASDRQFGGAPMAVLDAVVRVLKGGR